jgi:sugar phosphate isomerase/epimerase
MRFSAFTAALPEWTPEEAVKRLADQGWDGVEWRVLDQPDAPEGQGPGFWAGNLCTWPLRTLEEDVRRIREVTASAGLGISGIGGYALCDEESDVERLLAATAALGAQQVRVRTPALGGAAYPELFTQTRRHFERIADRAAHYGVRALVELHHQTLISSASAGRRLLEGLDPSAVGVIHDIGNLVIEGFEEPLAGLQLLGDYLAHVHVKNVAWVPGQRRADGALDWSHEWAPLADGVADIPAYFRALRAVGYDGWVTCEDFSTSQPLEERTRADLEFLQRAAAA